MVVKILRNEKYIGDALLQKTYTTDFLTKMHIKNNDTVLQYYVEGGHEAIIPKDIFLLVQEELVLRRVVHTNDNGKRLIAKITVFDNRFTVDFNSSITIDIEA